MGIIAEVEGLSIHLPNGIAVAERLQVELRAGEVVSVLGPSGAGKTTILQALLTPDELRQRGFNVTWSRRNVSEVAAFVPQRGALVDHLDVAGNIALAQAGGGLAKDPGPWLRAVDLDDALASPGRSVSALSGGQAQRVAVARVLAAGRKLIVLDEPSVGLDPLGVRLLARLLVTQARKHKAAIVIITHDLTLAGGASDQVLFLDPVSRAFTQVLPNWQGPAELAEDQDRLVRVADLEAEVEHLLLGDRPAQVGVARSDAGRGVLQGIAPLEPLRVAGESAVRLFEPRLLGESLHVLRRAAVQGLVRPLPFYATVGVLLGITVPYVIVHISSSLKPAAVLGLIGGTYIQSLAPPLSAIVFSATSGSAINAWLGGLRLNGQVLALQGLGVPPARYLWSPAWYALVVGYVVTFLVFVAAMTAGGWLLFTHYGVSEPLAKLTADFVDPPAARLPYLIRSLWLVASYALAVASIVVAKGRETKHRAEDVTLAMTSSVMRCTLFVVVMELATVALLFATTGGTR